MEGGCSAAYNGSYIFRWSTPLACPDYNASATCPPPPPGPLTWPLRHPRSTKRWGPPTWNMSMSTIMMPCNTSGAFDSELAAQYGIVDLDWSYMPGLQNLGAESVFRPRKRMSSFFLLK